MAIAAVCAALQSCVIGSRSAESGLPPPAGRLEITMRDYRFDFQPPVPRGRVVFGVSNAGTTNHAMTIVRLPEDYPPIDEQLHSDVRRGAPTIARVPSRPPGGGSQVGVDLGPGRYAVVCFVTDADGIIHGLKGMNAEFRVT